MLAPFEAASRVRATDDGRFRVDVPDGWQQGRGAFGGLVLAMLLRAMEESEADRARAARTLVGDLAGPLLPGEAFIAVDVLRRGSNQTNLRAELRQNEGVVAFASAVLSAARPDAISGFRSRIHPPPLPGTAIPIEAAPGAPVFARHFDYRVTGPLPWAGGSEPVVAGWVSFREPLRAIDAAALVALLDAHWPASFSVMNARRPMATVSFTAEILCDPVTLDPRAPLFYQARTVCENAGFQLEFRELHDARGGLVAANQQTFAVLK
jgi:acyl-Coa thioesterase superfamily protein/acyl-CoA thioesterase superfamily protein